jgi:Protein of unknown function (DUF2934)
MPEVAKAAGRKPARNQASPAPASAPAAKPSSAWNPTQQEIALVAYELYERRGRVQGHDREDWLQAERIVRARAAQKAS